MDRVNKLCLLGDSFMNDLSGNTSAHLLTSQKSEFEGSKPGIWLLKTNNSYSKTLCGKNSSQFSEMEDVWGIKLYSSQNFTTEESKEGYGENNRVLLLRRSMRKGKAFEHLIRLCGF